jgi:hypothetical protein
MGALMLMLLMPLLCWVFMHLVHYLGWLEFDVEFGTDYRFNDGLVVDVWLFRFPKLMERVLRASEERNAQATRQRPVEQIRSTETQGPTT